MSATDTARLKALATENARLRALLKAVPTLECQHCGGDAAWADCFEEREGSCDECGYPGAVRVGYPDCAWWNASEEELARCHRKDCSYCAALGKGNP